MIKEVIEDALARGEKLKKDIVGQILRSTALNDLVNNRHFADSIARVIQTKDEITRTLRRNTVEVLKMMRIPSKDEIEAYEKRVDRLEREIDRLGRNAMKKKLHSRGNSRHPRKKR